MTDIQAAAARTSQAPSSALCRLAGRNLRTARNALGLSLAGLAALSGMSAASIGMHERAERVLGLDDLERLARALGRKPQDLLAGQPVCPVCEGKPPPGFSCDSCTGLRLAPALAAERERIARLAESGSATYCRTCYLLSTGQEATEDHGRHGFAPLIRQAPGA